LLSNAIDVARPMNRGKLLFYRYFRWRLLPFDAASNDNADGEMHRMDYAAVRKGSGEPIQ
jgi:hypothetical protein